MDTKSQVRPVHYVETMMLKKAKIVMTGELFLGMDVLPLAKSNLHIPLSIAMTETI